MKVPTLCLYYTGGTTNNFEDCSQDADFGHSFTLLRMPDPDSTDSLTGNQSNELHVAVVVKSFALSFVPDPTQGAWYDRRSFRRVFVIISHERALVIASLTFGRNGQDLWS